MTCCAHVMWESHTVAMTFIYCKCYIIGAYFCPVEVEATHPLLQHVLLPRPLTTSSSFPQFRCQRTTCIVTQALPPTPPPSWHHQVSEWHNVNVKWHDMKRSAYWFHVMLHDITVHYTQIATPPGPGAAMSQIAAPPTAVWTGSLQFKLLLPITLSRHSLGT